jgi:hypothetical protein
MGQTDLTKNGDGSMNVKVTFESVDATWLDARLTDWGFGE